MAKEHLTDAVVPNKEGAKWANELLKQPASELANDLAAVEPALVAMSLRIADVTRNYLISEGVPRRVADCAHTKVVMSGVVTCQMLRRGYAVLLADLIDSSTPEHQGEKP